MTATTTWSGIGAEQWDGTPCPDDLRLISASSVPKALASPSLERWALNTTIEMLVEQMPRFQAMAAQDIEATVAWASQLRWQPKAGAELNAADSGTAMHSLLEAWMRGVAPEAGLVEQVQRDPELTAMATNIWGWFNRCKPEPVAVEQVVYDTENGLAGRLDLLVRFPTMPQYGLSLVDLKNSREAVTKGGAKKRPYGDSHALQLAAYRYCTLVATFEPRIALTQRATRDRTYLLNPREQAACQPAQEIQSTFILQNNPARCDLYPIETGEAVRRRLLDVLGAHRWLKEECRLVVGAPVTPPIELPTLS